MNDSPKVSVLMLTYNHEKYIGEAIRSVLLQRTTFSFQLVIGNDCSTDNTGKICAAWKEKYPDKIVLFNREKNVGLIQNFILTYKACEGEYIAICEGDDFWTDSSKLQKQVNFLETHPGYSICFHRVVNYYTANKTKSLSNGRQKAHTGMMDLARSNYITNVSAVFRNRLINELPDWFPSVSSYDYPLHLLNAQFGDIYYMKKPMAVYRQHQEAIWSTSTMDKKLKISLNVRELLMRHFHDREEIYSPLLTATTSILYSLLDYYKKTDNPEGIAEVEAKLHSYHPEWDKKVLPERVQTSGLKGKLFVVLKKARAFVSWFFPLPRIR